MGVVDKVGGYVAKTIVLGAYDEAKEANKKTDDYQKFVNIMDQASKRSQACKPGELSRDCPISATLPQHQQKGMTTHGPYGGEHEHMSGTAPLRIYTVVGSDGQTINVQGHDLSKTVTYTVVHKDGTSDVEELDADEAMKRIQREAAYPNNVNNRI